METLNNNDSGPRWRRASAGDGASPDKPRRQREQAAQQSAQLGADGALVPAHQDFEDARIAIAYGSFDQSRIDVRLRVGIIHARRHRDGSATSSPGNPGAVPPAGYPGPTARPAGGRLDSAAATRPA